MESKRREQEHEDRWPGQRSEGRPPRGFLFALAAALFLCLFVGLLRRRSAAGHGQAPRVEEKEGKRNANRTRAQERDIVRVGPLVREKRRERGADQQPSDREYLLAPSRFQPFRIGRERKRKGRVVPVTM